MSKQKFKVQVVRYFESEEKATQVARRALTTKGSEVTIFREKTTNSGQCYEREPIWKNGVRR